VRAESHTDVQPQLASRPFARTADFVLGILDLGEDPATARQEQPAFRSGSELARGAIEKPCPEHVSPAG
jgi:hypothetical protein